MVHAGLEPAVSGLRGRRDIRLLPTDRDSYVRRPRFELGPVSLEGCRASIAPAARSPSGPIRTDGPWIKSPERLPLRHGGLVGRPGVEPGSLAYKTRTLTGELAPSWPPRSRTAPYPLIRRAPSTGWVVASGCGRSRTCKAVKLARVQAGFRRRSDCASMGEGGGHAPQRLRAHPVSGRGLLLGSFTFHGGGRSTRSSALVRPFAFQATPVP